MRKVALILVCVTGLGFWAEATAASSILFGPTIYIRTAGQPNTYTETFASCEPEAKYQLVVGNRQEEGYKRISSARILLNGLEVLSPDELNQQVGFIQKPISLQAQNTLEVKLTSGPGGQLTISIECVANCFEINISSPADKSMISRGEVLVTGIVSSRSEEVGIAINDKKAQISGNQFAGNRVPLTLGENTITASAINACGQKTEASIVVQATSTSVSTLLTANPRGGSAPLTVTLHASAVLSRPIVQYQWDLTGDGTFDTFGAKLTDLSTTYDEEGLYFPTVTITDDQQNRYTETIAVNVLNKDETDALILKKWEAMKTAMKNKDVEGAVAFFADTAQERYRKAFTVMKDAMPQMVEELGTPRLIRLAQNGAFYELRTVRDGKAYSFHVEFVKDSNGLWKIRFF